MPKFELDTDIPLQSTLVPTAETVRIRYFLDLLLEKKRPVMLVGGAGTGKTVLMQEKLNSMPDEYITQKISLNFYTTSEMLQKVMEKPLEKKAGRNVFFSFLFGFLIFAYFMSKYKIKNGFNIFIKFIKLVLFSVNLIVRPARHEETDLLHRRLEHARSGQVLHSAAAHAAEATHRLQSLVRQSEADAQGDSQRAVRRLHEPDCRQLHHRLATAATLLRLRTEPSRTGRAQDHLLLHPAATHPGTWQLPCTRTEGGSSTGRVRDRSEHSSGPGLLANRYQIPLRFQPSRS